MVSAPSPTLSRSPTLATTPLTVMRSPTAPVTVPRLCGAAAATAAAKRLCSPAVTVPAPPGPAPRRRRSGCAVRRSRCQRLPDPRHGGGDGGVDRHRADLGDRVARAQGGIGTQADHPAVDHVLAVGA